MTVLEAATRPAAPPSPAGRVAIRRTVTGVGVALALLVLAGAALLTLLPLVTGATARTVLTGSMQPALPVGSVVFDRPVDPATLRVGDIAMYRDPDGHLVTHRIVAIGQASFVFRGDANPVADPGAVPADRMVGRVWFDVPWLGTARSRLAESRPLLLWLGAVGLAMYSLGQIRGGLRERRDGA